MRNPILKPFTTHKRKVFTSIHIIKTNSKYHSYFTAEMLIFKNSSLILTLIISSSLAFTASATNTTCVEGECSIYLEIDANDLGGGKFEVVSKICNKKEGATLIADSPSTFFSLGGHRVPDPFFQLQIPPEQCRTITVTQSETDYKKNIVQLQGHMNTSGDTQCYCNLQPSTCDYSSIKITEIADSTEEEKRFIELYSDECKGHYVVGDVRVERALTTNSTSYDHFVELKSLQFDPNGFIVVCGNETEAKDAYNITCQKYDLDFFEGISMGKDYFRLIQDFGETASELDKYDNDEEDRNFRNGYAERTCDGKNKWDVVTESDNYSPFTWCASSEEPSVPPEEPEEPGEPEEPKKSCKKKDCK